MELASRHLIMLGTEEIIFHDDDPFYSEIAYFIDAIEGKQAKSAILSSYSDAINTYAMVCIVHSLDENRQILISLM